MGRWLSGRGWRLRTHQLMRYLVGTARRGRCRCCLGMKFVARMTSQMASSNAACLNSVKKACRRSRHRTCHIRVPLRRAMRARTSLQRRDVAPCAWRIIAIATLAFRQEKSAGVAPRKFRDYEFARPQWSPYGMVGIIFLPRRHHLEADGLHHALREQALGVASLSRDSATSIYE